MAKRGVPGGLGWELLPLALIVASLAGTLALVIAMHRRALDRPDPAKPDPPPTVVLTPEPEPDAVEPEPPTVVVEPPKPGPPPEDPTRPILAKLAARKAEADNAAKDALRQAEAFDTARKAAEAESERWRSRELIVRGQIEQLGERAERLEQEADALARERDVLAQEKESAKAALAKAKANNGGYAVMPNKSPNGTWQRPVTIECRDGKAILQPVGLGFSMMEMSPFMDNTRSPLLLAVVAEMLKVQRSSSPDGRPVTPYIYFLVRPDGIRPFYEARACLERIGIAFGYELVDQNWQIEFPDYDDLVAWEGNPTPKPKVVATAPEGGGRRPTGSRGSGSAGGSGRVAGAGGSVGAADSPFLWPAAPRGGQALAGGGALGGGVGGMNDGPSGNGQAGSGTSGNGEPAAIVSLDPSALPASPGGGERRPVIGGRIGGDGAVGRRKDRESRLDRRRPDGRSSRRTRRGPEGLVTLWNAPDGNRRVPLGGRRPRSAVTHGGGDRPRATLRPEGPRPDRSRGARPLGRGRRGGDDPDRPAALPRNARRPPGNNVPTESSTSGSDMVPPPPLLTDGTNGGSPLMTPGPGMATGPTGSGSDAQASAGSGSGPGDGSGIISDLPATNAPTTANRANGQRTGTGTSTATDRQGMNSQTLNAATNAQATTGNPSISPPSSTPPTSAVAFGSAAGSPGASSGGQPPSGISLPSFLGSSTKGSAASGGSDADPTSRRDSKGMATPPPRPDPDRPKIRVEVPLVLTVTCGPKGVTIHPGAYRLSKVALKRDGALANDLKTIVRNHELIDPMVTPIPRVEFLIEAGGGESYQLARKQTLFGTSGWPVTFRIAESASSPMFTKERF